jgi:hypothetical protein
MKLPAYEVLAQAFVAEGVDTVFTLMGDANMHWANAMATMASGSFIPGMSIALWRRLPPTPGRPAGPGLPRSPAGLAWRGRKRYPFSNFARSKSALARRVSPFAPSARPRNSRLLITGPVAAAIISVHRSSLATGEMVFGDLTTG